MPRLNHKKTRTGCQRCKARKVKCDERKPQCTACARHNVPCDYVNGSSTNTESLPSVTPPNNGPYYTQPEQNGHTAQNFDPVLELRLMHEWTAYTCKTFTPAWEFWCYQAPLLALDYRYLLDAMMAMAALHASRQIPSQWNPIEGRMMPISDLLYDPARDEEGSPTHWRWRDLHNKSVLDSVVNELKESGESTYLSKKRDAERMLTVSRVYFDRALEGYREAVDKLTIENIEAVFTTSMLTSFNALFALSEDEGDPASPSVDPSFWLRLGRGSYHIIQRWRELAGFGWIAHSGVYYGTPDLSSDVSIFQPEHNKHFGKLLTFATDFEAITDEDRKAYEWTLAYLGMIHKNVVECTDAPLTTCRRLVAMPSKCPPRFVDLVEARHPRAMVMLAHLFAAMKLIDQSVEWLAGIAERQVPKIFERLPVGWREMMAWPMAVSQGEVDREPRETRIDDALTS